MMFTSCENVRRLVVAGAGGGKTPAQQLAEQITKRLERAFAWVELAKIDIDGLDVWVRLEHSYPEDIDIQAEVMAWVVAELAKVAIGPPPPAKIKVQVRPCTAGAHREGARVLSW